MDKLTKGRIFGCYIGQKVETKDYGIAVLTTIDINNDRYPLWFGNSAPENKSFTTDENYNSRGQSYGLCRILVKPLSNLTDEDSIEVCKIVQFSTNIVSTGKAVVLEIFVKQLLDYAPKEVMLIYHYLLSKGYALSYMNYTVEDLVKEGIYKLID
ncbi:MAG TPA: hypothetical protein VN922_19425 [Bacteroidia bacterium]|nr:hypothetical protein [Bacteroidia bacterium]